MKKEAYLYDKLPDNKVKCRLCPKECIIKENEQGFCTVRTNTDGILYADNYGESTYFVRDTIETEGVYHYKPGCFSIEVGTYGCNFHCDFCQNWRYSRTDTVKMDALVTYTPQQLVDKCIEMDIKLIAWTFNDPIIWYEFIMDTAGIAKANGITSLYKSSHFISQEALENLCAHVDIFSISLKSIKDEFYRKYCTGWIEPVKESLKYLVGRGDKHVEVSNLVIPTINDSEEEVNEFNTWILENIGDSIPVHFVRYHPDYKFTIERTPEETVMAIRAAALKAGIKHAYVGNVFSSVGINTYCTKCNNLLIKREGRRVEIDGMDESTGTCKKCNHKVENMII